MEARDEDDSVVDYSIEKPVRKPMDEGTASFAVHDRIRFGPIQNCFYGIPNLCKELLAKRLALRLVPSMRSRDICRGGRTEDVISHRDRARI